MSALIPERSRLPPEAGTAKWLIRLAFMRLSASSGQLSGESGYRGPCD